MKKIYLVLLLSAFAAATHAADDERKGPSGFINEFIDIPGDTLANVSSTFLTSISNVITSFGKAFGDAGKDIDNNGNISR